MRHGLRIMREQNEFFKEVLKNGQSKPQAVPFELEHEVQGYTKAAPFELLLDDLPSRDRDELIAHFERLNDVRAEVASEIERLVESCDSVEGVKKAYIKTRRKNIGKNINNDFTSVIAERAGEVLKKLYDIREPGPLVQVVATDLTAKLSSFFALWESAVQGSAKDGIDYKTVFNTWNKDSIQSALDSTVWSSVLGKDLPSRLTERTLRAELLRLTREELGNDYFKSTWIEIEPETGKVKLLRGKEGVRRYNVIVSHLMMRIGQYLGQSKVAHWKQVFETHGLPFPERPTWKRLMKLAQEAKNPEGLKAELSFKFPKIKLERIKKYPAFPTFRKVTEIKTANRFKTFFESLEQSYRELLAEVEKEGILSEEGFWHFVLGNKELSNWEQQLKEFAEENSPSEGQVNRASVGFRREVANTWLVKGRAKWKEIYSVLKQRQKTKIQNIVACIEEKPKSVLYRDLALAYERLIHLEIRSRTYEKPGAKYALFESGRQIIGRIQMESLRGKLDIGFSIQYRKWDQAGCYPTLYASEENPKKLRCLFAIDIGRKSEEAYSVSSFSWKEDGRVSHISKKTKRNLVRVSMGFGKRVGRKFFLHRGLRPAAEQNYAVKWGSPNFTIRYDTKGKKPVRVFGTVAMVRWKGFFPRSLVEANKTDFKDRDAWMVKLKARAKYVIGVDRGENTLLAASIFENKNGRLHFIKPYALGTEYKQEIEELKEAIAQRQMAHRSARILNARLRGVLAARGGEAVRKLKSLAIEYGREAKRKEKCCVVVFEHIKSDFRREGKRAYLELQQMHKLLRSIKGDRDYYNLPFLLYGITPQHTSKRCAECGSLETSRGSIGSGASTEFKCNHCGFEGDADLNASKNIARKWWDKEEWEKGSGGKRVA